MAIDVFGYLIISRIALFDCLTHPGMACAERVACYWLALLDRQVTSYLARFQQLQQFGNAFVHYLRPVVRRRRGAGSIGVGTVAYSVGAGLGGLMSIWYPGQHCLARPVSLSQTDRPIRRCQQRHRIRITFTVV